MAGRPAPDRVARYGCAVSNAEAQTPRPVAVGVIGVGNALPGYLGALDRLCGRGAAELRLICARRRSAWPAVLARRPGARLVADVSDVLDADLDVVLIITPPDSHADLAVAALERGKHVVVEKPLALDPMRARAVCELARSRGRHLLVSPFVQLSPTFRALWTTLVQGSIGRVHSARGLYGNPGSDWAPWYHRGGIGPLAEAGIYNVKSLTALLGPVVEVHAAETTAISPREVAGETIEDPDADVVHVMLRHRGGALSSIVASHAIGRYRRTALELYGVDGTANLLGDDWDPAGFEIWRAAHGRWEQYDSLDPTWHWSDGLNEVVAAIRQERAPLVDLDHDVHVLDVIAAARRAASERIPVAVESEFGPLELSLKLDPAAARRHDHTRAPDKH
jgi:predicted dehydrogenase